MWAPWINIIIIIIIIIIKRDFSERMLTANTNKWLQFPVLISIVKMVSINVNI